MADWKPIETAPKDGTRIILAGKWNTPGVHSYGEWTQEIFSWSSFSSDGDPNKQEWISSAGLAYATSWAVDWLMWTELPEDPKD